jgi:hypothetical protein
MSSALSKLEPVVGKLIKRATYVFEYDKMFSSCRQWAKRTMSNLGVLNCDEFK